MKHLNVIVYTLGNEYRYILDSSNWIISVLIVDNEEWKKNIYEYEKKLNRLDRIHKIVTLYDFYYNDDLSYLNRKLVFDNTASQLCFIKYMYRFSDDIQEINDTYFNTLAFAAKLYKTYECDLFINMNFNHGNCDTIMSNLACQINIQSINIEPMLLKKKCIYNNVSNDLVKLVKVCKSDISKCLFYDVNIDYNGKKGNSEKNKVVFLIKKTMGKFSYKIGGWLGERLLMCVYKRNFYIETMFKEKKWSYFFKLYKKLIKSREVLEKSYSTLESGEKYVFFPLHFEPEATIDGRALITCQLTILRMISQSLPQGWVCAVKEHPHQFLVNTDTFSSFIHTSGKFKTKYFYNELSKIPNVKIVDTKIPSINLIKGAQAIATMSGTVAAETVPFSKPILVFAGTRTVYRKSKRFTMVNSYNDCRNALLKIEKDNITYENDFQEVCDRYLFESTSADYKIAIDSIERAIIGFV